MLLCEHVPFWTVDTLTTNGPYIPSAIHSGAIHSGIPDTPEKFAHLLRQNHAQRFKSASLTEDNAASFVQSLHDFTAPPCTLQIVRIDSVNIHGIAQEVNCGTPAQARPEET
jgi:hypothetical protein